MSITHQDLMVAFSALGEKSGVVGELGRDNAVTKMKITMERLYAQRAVGAEALMLATEKTTALLENKISFDEYQGFILSMSRDETRRETKEPKYGLLIDAMRAVSYVCVLASLMVLLSVEAMALPLALVCMTVLVIGSMGFQMARRMEAVDADIARENKDNATRRPSPKLIVQPMSLFTVTLANSESDIVCMRDLDETVRQLAVVA